MDPEVVRTQITAFVTTYNINVAELLEPDLKVYKVCLVDYRHVFDID